MGKFSVHTPQKDKYKKSLPFNTFILNYYYPTSCPVVPADLADLRFCVYLCKSVRNVCISWVIFC